MALEVSTIDSGVLPTSRLGSVSALQAETGLLGAGAVSGAQFDGASIVTLSPLAQLLATTAVFQAQQDSASGVAYSNANVNAYFPDFATSANLFVSKFNNFQASSGGELASSFELAFGSALSDALLAENSQEGSSITQSLIDGLASIGVNYQPANPSQFQIDWATLQASFNANPGQASALLSNAFQLLSAVEESIATSQSAQEQYLYAPQFGLLTNTYAQNAYAALQLLVDDMTSSQEVTTAADQTSANVNAAAVPVSASAASPTPNSVSPGIDLTVTATVVATPSPALSTPNAANNADTNAIELPNSAVLQIAMDPVQTDPLIATAVAAYRIGEAVASTRSDIRNITTINPDDEIARIYRTNPVTLELHEGDGGNERGA